MLNIVLSFCVVVLCFCIVVYGLHMIYNIYRNERLIDADIEMIKSRLSPFVEIITKDPIKDLLTVKCSHKYERILIDVTNLNRTETILEIARRCMTEMDINFHNRFIDEVTDLHIEPVQSNLASLRALSLSQLEESNSIDSTGSISVSGVHNDSPSRRPIFHSIPPQPPPIPGREILPPRPTPPPIRALDTRRRPMQMHDSFIVPVRPNPPPSPPPRIGPYMLYTCGDGTYTSSPVNHVKCDVTIRVDDTTDEDDINIIKGVYDA